MALSEIELLREAYRQLKKCGFHQKSPGEKARLEALFKRLAGFLKDGDWETANQRISERKPRGQAFEGSSEIPPLKKGGGGDLSEGKSSHSALSTQHSGLSPDTSLLTPHSSLILNVDGASKGNPGPAGAGGVLVTPEGEEVESFSIYLGEKTNNEAEYLALIEGLKRTKVFSPAALLVRSDSLLLIRQMRGEFKVKKYELVKLHLEARRHFPCKGIRWEHIPREMNAAADRLADLGAKAGPGVQTGLDSARRPS